jgi:NitT/TauT family transport system permease protein
MRMGIAMGRVAASSGEAITPVSSVSSPIRFRRTVIIWTTRGLVAAAFIFLWWLVVAVKLVPAFYISTPVSTWKFLVHYIGSGDILPDARATVFETLVGFGIGSSAGVLAGLLLARFDFLNRVFSPFLNGLNSLPRVALAPLFILWFGIGSQAKIVLSISLVFFIALINTEAGVRSTDADLLLLARALGAEERQSFLKVVLPNSVPSIFAGLKVGGVYSLLGAVVGEMLSAQHGWGAQITYYSQTFDVGAVFAVLLILAIFSISFNQVMVSVERRLLRWQRVGVANREGGS